MEVASRKEVFYLEIWLLVLILLVIAIIFLVASLFTRNDSDIEDLINDTTIQLSQELNAIKTRLSELESVVYHHPEALRVKPITATASESVYQSTVETRFAGEGDDEPTNFVPETPMTEETRNTIIKLYSQGYTLKEISDDVHLDSLTVQTTIDDYIENR